MGSSPAGKHRLLGDEAVVAALLGALAGQVGGALAPPPGLVVVVRHRGPRGGGAAGRVEDEEGTGRTGGSASKGGGSREREREREGERDKERETLFLLQGGGRKMCSKDFNLFGTGPDLDEGFFLSPSLSLFRSLALLLSLFLSLSLSPLCIHPSLYISINPSLSI